MMPETNLPVACDHCVALAILKKHCIKTLNAQRPPAPNNITWTCDHCEAAKRLFDTVDSTLLDDHHARLQVENRFLHSELARKRRLVERLRRTLRMLAPVAVQHRIARGGRV
jgi:glutaredoxin